VRVLRYGGDEAFPPFESLDAQGRPVGFHVDLLAALGRELNARIEVSLQSWPATIEAFRAGRVDLVAMVETTNRRAFARFLHSHAAPLHAVYLPAGAAAPRALQDLQGVRLAVLDTEPMRESLARWLSGVRNPLRVDSPRAALEAVQRGDADMALLPRSYGDPLLAAMPGLVAGERSFSLQTYAFAVPPGREALRTELQAAIDRLEANGTLPALRERWLPGESGFAQAERQAMARDLRVQQRWTWGLAAGASVLLLGSAWALARRGRAVARERRQRHEAELALRQAQELLDRTFQRNPEPLLLIDHRSGVVRDANSALAALLGVPIEGLVGQTLRALAHHADRVALQGMVNAINTDGLFDGLPLTVTHRDGTRRACLVHAERLQVGESSAVLCIVRDVSGRLASDAGFRLAYEQLRDEAARDLGEAVPGPQPLPGEDRAREFTRAVAHDLRAPLLAIQGFVSLLRERLALGYTDEALEYSEQVEKATRRMNAMIEALSHLAQVEQREQVRQTMDMRELCEETWALVQAADPKRQVDVRIDDLPPAQGDPDLVAQVWQNLLHNAWKYSRRNPEARVRVDSHSEGLRTWYRVTDNGVGFDMARAQHLFQPFRRMHPSSQFEGSGVGLSMVQRIVRHHGGQVHVRSQVGVGTVAEFTLDPEPAAVQAPRTEAPTRA
jgi:PAS domain S-box-containing protein